MLTTLRKLTPKPVFRLYHYTLARIASLIYGNPSNRMYVIGVTGTNGKSSTVRMIYKILEESGEKVGAAGTVEFKVAETEWLNNTKMTMVGRFQLQKLLRDMYRAGCTTAIIETTSEGIVQFRHTGINYDVVVFTNLTPEHIESHGSFENYRDAKAKLFKHLARCKKKHRSKIFPDQKDSLIDKIAVVNADDPHAEFFLSQGEYRKFGFTLKSNANNLKFDTLITAKRAGQTAFDVNGTVINMKLLGEYNLYNALAAFTATIPSFVKPQYAKAALEKIENIPGRLEMIPNNKGIQIMVDYAPEPESVRQLYKVLKEIPYERLIHILGSAGGGRDTARRPILGELAGEEADIVIVTNEDPYDEDPMQIINAVAEGAMNKGKQLGINLYKILDRREAIRHALALTQPNDLLLITGKGCEQAIVVKNREKIPWDDRVVIQEELKRLSGQ